jgi:hypothetical protein
VLAPTNMASLLGECVCRHSGNHNYMFVVDGQLTSASDQATAVWGAPLSLDLAGEVAPGESPVRRPCSPPRVSTVLCTPNTPPCCGYLAYA